MANVKLYVERQLYVIHLRVANCARKDIRMETECEMCASGMEEKTIRMQTECEQCASGMEAQQYVCKPNECFLLMLSELSCLCAKGAERLRNALLLLACAERMLSCE